MRRLPICSRRSPLSGSNQHRPIAGPPYPAVAWLCKRGPDIAWRGRSGGVDGRPVGPLVEESCPFMIIAVPFHLPKE